MIDRDSVLHSARRPGSINPSINWKGNRAGGGGVPLNNLLTLDDSNVVRFQIVGTGHLEIGFAGEDDVFILHDGFWYPHQIRIFLVQIQDATNIAVVNAFVGVGQRPLGGQILDLEFYPQALEKPW